MSVSMVVGLASVVALVAGAAWLSTVDTVLQRLDLVRALAIDEEERGSRQLVWALEHRGTCLNVVLLLTVVVRVTTTVLAAALATEWWPGAPGLAVTAVVVSIVLLLGAEVTPRTVAMRHPDRTGLRIARPLRALVAVLAPVAAFFVRTGRTLAGGRPGAHGPFPTDEPAGEVLHPDDDTDDALEEDERAMIRSIFELGDTIAREIMVPRPDMVTVEESAALRILVNTIIEHGYSRIPVFRDDREEIRGVVYAKDVLRRIALQPDRGDWRDLLRPATFIPETKRIDDLLRELQEQSVHIAFVVDEYGATTGLVTIEDVLEEIVGEIVDEHDHEAPLVEVLDDDRFRIDARLPVDELNALLGAHLPDDEWDTVGGLVVGALGYIPSPGEAVELDGVTLVAERVQGRRVAKVMVTRPRVEAGGR